MKERRSIKLLVEKGERIIEQERLQQERLVNQPTQKKENSKIKQNLIYIGFIGLIIFGLYYFMSPYRNCIRDSDAILSTEYKGKKLSYEKILYGCENRILLRNYSNG